RGRTARGQGFGDPRRRGPRAPRRRRTPAARAPPGQPRGAGPARGSTPDEGRRGRPDPAAAGDGGQARGGARSGRERGRSRRGPIASLTGPRALIGSTWSSVTAGAVRAYDDVRAICPYSAESL